MRYVALCAPLCYPQRGAVFIGALRVYVICAPRSCRLRLAFVSFALRIRVVCASRSWRLRFIRLHIIIYIGGKNVRLSFGESK